MKFMKRRREPEPVTDPVLCARLKSITLRSKSERYADLEADAGLKRGVQVERRFWTPHDLEEPSW
jgi:hypothetical protein